MTRILMNPVLQHIDILMTMIWCLCPIEYVLLFELLESTHPIECEEQLAAQKKSSCTEEIQVHWDSEQQQILESDCDRRKAL